MSPIGKNTITHFTHPAHKLTEIKSNAEYNCDGCKLNGNGTRFSCSQCGFNLHEHCAQCPRTLTSGMHPWHPLRLVVHHVSLATPYCRACRNPVEGLVYQCSTEDCSFVVHPGCDTTRTTNTHEQGQAAPATVSRQAGGSPSNTTEKVAVKIATGAAYHAVHAVYAASHVIRSSVMSLFESSADS